MFNKIRKKHKDIFIFIMTFLLFTFVLIICDGNNSDQIWEYGFSHNILQGMIPYKDFNMVTLPLHSYLCAFFLKIFSDKYIVYLFFHVVLMTTISFLVYKKTDKIYQYVFSLLFLLMICAATYNILLLFLFYLILLLEEKEVNDYFIGVLLSFAILTKQSVGVFLLVPTLFLKDKKKIGKRFISILGIALVYFIYLIVTNSFYDCINYTILGLLDFSVNNTSVNIFFYFYILYVIMLIRNYIKGKEFKYLYYLGFSTVCIPLFDFHHFFVAVTPFILDILKKVTITNKTLQTTLLIYSILSILYVLSFKVYDRNQYILETSKDNVFYLTREKYKNTYEVSNHILEFFKKNKDKKIYIIGDSSYFFSLDNHIPITKFSLILYGNNGYKGNVYLEKIIDNLEDGTLFIIDSSITSKQHNKEMHEYIINHSIEITKINENIRIYEKNKA